MQQPDETWEDKQDHISPSFSVIGWWNAAMDKKQENWDQQVTTHHRPNKQFQFKFVTGCGLQATKFPLRTMGYHWTVASVDPVHWCIPVFADGVLIRSYAKFWEEINIGGQLHVYLYRTSKKRISLGKLVLWNINSWTLASSMHSMDIEWPGWTIVAKNVIR